MLDQEIGDKLKSTAKALVSSGKGILAADESSPTIEKRFESIGVPSSKATRQAYREMLFMTKGIGEFISGVIMFDETIRQQARDGTPFPDILRTQGVIPGIKVDEGKDPLPDSPEETLTKGLDGLSKRLEEYRKLGAEFTKWRAVIKIGDGLPTQGAIEANAEALAEYAKVSQEAGFVPIVEPEVLMDGDHDIARCEEVTNETLKIVYQKLNEQGVMLAGTLLKPNMILPGKGAAQEVSPQDVARATLRVLKQTVPEDVPGIVFLSGGQTEEQATTNLNEMNKLEKSPWGLSFSYGRALQTSALKTWSGRAENVSRAQKVFYKRAKLNSQARLGQYNQEMEHD